MKKIFKVTNWSNTPTVITTDQLANKSHWIIKSLSDCLTMMGLTPTFTYKIATGSNCNTVYLSIEGYEGTVYFTSVNMKYYSNTTSFIWYVNTEKMELVGCAGGTESYHYNCFRSGAYEESNNDYKYQRCGPLFVIKLSGNKLKGYCVTKNIISNLANVGTTRYAFTQIGVPLADCNSITTVTAGVDYEDWAFNMPVLVGRDSNNDDEYLHFEGDYLEDVYLTEKYYNVPMKDVERNLYIYDGKAFLVDDLDDIGTIETTV